MGKLSIWTLSNEDVGDPSRSVGVNEFVDSGERENKRIGHHREKNNRFVKRRTETDAYISRIFVPYTPHRKQITRNDEVQ